MVDDDEDVRQIMADMLEDGGYEVRHYSSPLRFLAEGAMEDADVMVLDFMMPEMNGADLAREIRILRPRQRVIIVSGYADSATLDLLTDHQTKVLRKPFSSDVLVDAITNWESPERRPGGELE